MKHKNIVLIGMPGSGKTTFGKKLAEILGRKFYDADDVLVAREKHTIKELFDEGEKCFRDAETRTLCELSKLDGVVIATGGGAVLRPENMEMLKENGVVIFINRSPDKIYHCINDNYRPLLADDKMKIYNLYAERKDLYQRYANYIVPNNGDSEETIHKLICHAQEVIKSEGSYCSIDDLREY